MKYTLWMLIVCCLFVGGAAVVRRSIRSNTQQQQNQPTTIHGKVQRAKETGKKGVYIPAPIPFYAEVDSLDEALSNTRTVVAMPVKKTTVLLDPESIVTFYKLKIIDSLTQNTSASCCAPTSIPSELPALNPDEIYLQVGGGIIIVDGIMVNAEEEFGRLELFKQYLFFLSQNSDQPIAMVKLGAGGIFTVNEDGNLETIISSKNSDKTRAPNRVKSVIEQGLETLHGYSLARLKASVMEKRGK